MENAYGVGYDNEKNTNKNLLLLIKDYLVYIIILLGKSNIFSVQLNPDYFQTMSFSSERVICYFLDQFYYYLLIGYIKTTVMLKPQQFEDSESDMMELKVSKYQRIDERDNEEENSSSYKYKDKIEVTKYISSLFIALFFLPQKESNRPSELGEETKSRNHLIYT